MKSITIIGGGLAGLSLGVCLRKRGIQVELHEKGGYPRHKVCGEFISGVSHETVELLGIREQLEDALVHEDISWWMGGDKLLTRRLPAPAMGISRFRLDQRLVNEFVHLGGKLTVGRRKEIESFSRAGTIVAGGKPVQKKSDDLPDWIGLKIHAINTEIEGLQMHSGARSGRGGYVGLCQVEDRRVNCCGLFHLRGEIKPSVAEAQREGPAAMLMAYAEASGMYALVELMEQWDFDPGSASSIAGFKLGRQEQRGYFCVGDAASLIPPFTGNGMSMALESSAIAAGWVEKYCASAVSWSDALRGYERELERQFSRRLQLSQILHPLLFNRVGQAALKTAAKLQVLPFNTLFTTLRKP